MLRSMIITTSFDFSVDAMIVRAPGLPQPDQEQALIWRLRILDLTYATFLSHTTTEHQALIDIQARRALSTVQGLFLS